MFVFESLSFDRKKHVPVTCTSITPQLLSDSNTKQIVVKVSVYLFKAIKTFNFQWT